MFVAFPRHPETDAPLHDQARWIDLRDPTPDETRLVEHATGLMVPGRPQLVEIENSSRLQRRGEALYLSMPALLRTEGNAAQVSPVGFVLTRERLITVRYAELPAFDFVANAMRAAATEAGNGVGVFLLLMEAMVDRLADVLEQEGEALDLLSRHVFRPDKADKTDKAGKGMNVDRTLRATLRRIGGAGDLVAKIRDALLGVGRVLQYVMVNANDWFAPDHKNRFKTLRADIASLSDYDGHLANKAQFLLDATVGLIGIEQSNKFTLLTIVSTIGVPPTFIASLYGMNFEHMPELKWTWGYEYSLALIVISAIVPLVWFKRKGWL